MSNSLRDQLLQAGFKAKPKPVKNNSKKNKKFTKSNTKQTNNKKHKPNLAQLYKQRANLENKENIKKAKEKQQLNKLRKENNKKIRQLILKNSIKRDEADIRYNFVVGSTIKHIYVTKEQQDILATGELGITFLDGKRHLLPIKIIQEIKQLKPDKIVVIIK